jgi:hypothetical protein
MSQQGIREFAKIILLVGGVLALVGGLLGLVGGFIGAGSALALVVGLLALLYYGRLGSEGFVVALLILGLIVAVITGGIPSVGGILISVGALVVLLGRYSKL